MRNRADKKLQTDRRTDPQADSYILPKQSFGGYNEPEMMISVFDRIENIVRKGENAGNQHFLLFPQSFQTALFPGR